MDCERFDRLSLELLYDELDELSAAATRRHLHHCTRCQGIWAKLKVTRDLAHPPLEEPPADLFNSILVLEREAHKELPFRERAGRIVSILAGYAMRPQLAMAALLLLMVGSSLIFTRITPSGKDQIGVIEGGSPSSEIIVSQAERSRMALQVESEGDDLPEPRRARAPAAAEAAPLAQNQMLLQAKEESAQSSTEDIYRDALSAYQMGRYAEAERLFSEVAAAGGAKAGVAALHEAHAARNGSGCQRASALYDRVAERYAGQNLADEASWQAATCYQALGQQERARAHYKRLATRPVFAARAEQALAALSPAPSIAGAPEESEALAQQSVQRSAATTSGTPAAAPEPEPKQEDTSDAAAPQADEQPAPEKPAQEKPSEE